MFYSITALITYLTLQKGIFGYLLILVRMMLAYSVMDCHCSIVNGELVSAKINTFVGSSALQF